MLKLKKNNQPKPLGMKRFNFFYSVRCLLTMIFWIPLTIIIFAEANLDSIYISPLNAIVIIFCSVAMGIYSTKTYINYTKSRCFGFYPASVYYSTIKALTFEAVRALCLLNIAGIIPPALSIYYFSKRKFMFGLGK